MQLTPGKSDKTLIERGWGGGGEGEGVRWFEIRKPLDKNYTNHEIPSVVRLVSD